MFRILGELLHPIAQLRHMHAQVLRSLHIGHASILDQAHSLKLELAGKLPSLHDTPPAPSKHLTRCLRNRVQAIPPGVPSGIHMQMPTYNFTIGGTERRVTEACNEYLALLKQMVAKFRAEGSAVTGV